MLPGWVSRHGVPIFQAHGGGALSQCEYARCNNQWPVKVVSARASTCERVMIVDFDNVFFNTPERPWWWQFHGFMIMPESLLPPCVPAFFYEGFNADEWFNDVVLKEVKKEMRGASTFSVLHTFRNDAFKKRIEHIVEQGRGYYEIAREFDSMRFRPICKCCSRLGHTHTGEAGYGRLTRMLTAEPMRAEDKHLLVIVGDVLHDCLHATQLTLYLSKRRSRATTTRSRSGFWGHSSSQYERICSLLGAKESRRRRWPGGTAPWWNSTGGTALTRDNGLRIVIKGVEPNPHHPAGRPEPLLIEADYTKQLQA